MKRINRRHRNPKSQEENKKPFFSKSTDNSLQSKKDKDSFFQPKLTIGKKDDVEEKEAEIAAKKVVNKASEEKVPEEEPVQTTLDIQKQSEPEEEETLQGMPDIQKQEESDEEDTIQSKSEQKNEVSIPGLSENIKKSKGKGKPLSPIIRKEMETSFGTDFSKVIIHADQIAVSMCRKLKAMAFTNGYDIYFNAGQYNPGSKAGKKLLAHELTHVIQQRG